jgi:hypothetical protein
MKCDACGLGLSEEHFVGYKPSQDRFKPTVIQLCGFCTDRACKALGLDTGDKDDS